jgi:GntR family transcriptional repressor for pyruvate dehydrogenase complex
MFENLSAPKKSALVYHQIVDRIEAGEFPSKSKLPNEIELSRLMGVSRPVIREALSALEIVDIVERKAGDGTYVKEIPPKYEDIRFSKEPLVLKYFKKIEESGGSAVAFEARSMIEPMLAAMVAKRAKNNDIEAVRGICSRFAQALDTHDKELFLRTDIEFHRFIALTCGNKLLEGFMLQVIEAEQFYVWRTLVEWPSPERMKASVKEHTDVANAIIEGNETLARAAMESHFAFHWGEIDKTIATVPPKKKRPRLQLSERRRSI